MVTFGMFCKIHTNLRAGTGDCPEPLIGRVDLRTSMWLSLNLSVRGRYAVSRVKWTFGMSPDRLSFVGKPAVKSETNARLNIPKSSMQTGDGCHIEPHRHCSIVISQSPEAVLSPVHSWVPIDMSNGCGLLVQVQIHQSDLGSIATLASPTDRRMLTEPYRCRPF
jgi:hypothetical protein